MLEFLRGRRPDLTPAQLLATVPLVVALLVVVDVFDLAADERDALKWALVWAVALLAADTLLRIGRNIALGRGPLHPDEVVGGDELYLPLSEAEILEAERLEAEALPEGDYAPGGEDVDRP